MESLARFLAFWRTLLLRPKVFFQQYLTQEDRRPYFGLIVAVFCAITLLGAYREPGISIEVEVVRAYDQDTVFLAIWLVASLSRLLLGVLGYFALGWIVKLLVWLSGGTTTFRQARSIAIYTYAVGVVLRLSARLLAVCVATILPQAMALIYPKWAFIGLLLLGIYLIYIEYCGVIALTGARKGKAFFWFCVFPLLLSLLLMLRSSPAILFVTQDTAGCAYSENIALLTRHSPTSS